MLSIFAPHFFNWTQQLKDSGHEVYWLDIFDSNTEAPQINFAQQITGWRYKWNYPGRYRVKENLPVLNEMINAFNERKFTEFFEQKLKEIKPDVVHSFTIHLACFPIVKIMEKYSLIKWICSTWGSDLFYYRNNDLFAPGIEEVLSRLDFLFVDCQRDYEIAVSMGFKGELLGVFPGRGGFSFGTTDSYMRPLEERKLILIKGYQGELGRCIQILRAIEQLQSEFKNFQLTVFGAHKEVFDYVDNAQIGKWRNLQVEGDLPHKEVLKLMGEALLYIGNSISDGMPNTLMEAIIMGTFPIQSNPGGATAEIIKDGQNGLLLENPENVPDIKRILQRIFIEVDIEGGISYNLKNIKPTLERQKIEEEVLLRYKLVEKLSKNVQDRA